MCDRAECATEPKNRTVPLTAQDAFTPQAGAELLAQSYALAGSSYDPSGSLWALDSAVQDQFATLAAFSTQIVAARRTIATGESMGGLINSLIAQDGAGRITGSVNFCGLVVGGIDLTDYEINGEYALKTLIPGASGVQLRDFTSFEQGAASGTALQDAVAAAQNSATGRARIALAAALLNETDWASGPSAPAAGDYLGQEQQEEQTLTGGQLPFIVGAEAAIEQAEGRRPRGQRRGRLRPAAALVALLQPTQGPVQAGGARPRRRHRRARQGRDLQARRGFAGQHGARLDEHRLYAGP